MNFSEVNVSRKEDLVEFYLENKEAFDERGIELLGDNASYYKTAIREFLRPTPVSEVTSENVDENEPHGENTSNEEPTDEETPTETVETNNVPVSDEEVTETQPEQVSTEETVETPNEVDVVEEQAKESIQENRNTVASAAEEKATQDADIAQADAIAEATKLDKETEKQEEEESDDPELDVSDKEYHDMSAGELLLILQEKGFEHRKDIVEQITLLTRAAEVADGREKVVAEAESALAAKEAKMVSREASFDEQIQIIENKSSALKEEYAKLDAHKKKIKLALDSI